MLIYKIGYVCDCDLEMNWDWRDLNWAIGLSNSVIWGELWGSVVKTETRSYVYTYVLWLSMYSIWGICADFDCFDILKWIRSLKGLIVKLKSTSKNVIVYEENNSCEWGSVWLIIRYEVCEYDTMVLNWL